MLVRFRAQNDNFTIYKYAFSSNQHLVLYFSISPLLFFFILYNHLTLIALWPLERMASFQASFFIIALISLSITCLNSHLVQLLGSSLTHNYQRGKKGWGYQISQFPYKDLVNFSCGPHLSPPKIMVVNLHEWLKLKRLVD